MTPRAPTHDPYADLGVWGTVKLSLAGKELDFTTGPIGRAIILLSIPMVLEMVMESVFALTDAFFVSRVGTEAVATVGLTEAMVTLLFAVAGGMSIATTAMVARRIGEKDINGARVAAAQAILLGVGISVCFAVPGVFFARRLLAAMGGSPELVASGYGFTEVIFGGSSTIVLLFLLNAVFRGAGDAAIAMRVLWIANAINIVLDPCLIFGLGPFPEMGVTGAAVATTIGRGIGVVLQLGVLFFGGSRIRIDLLDLLPRLGVMLRLFRLSVGGILQNAISHSSWLFWSGSSATSARPRWPATPSPSGSSSSPSSRPGEWPTPPPPWSVRTSAPANPNVPRPRPGARGSTTRSSSSASRLSS